MLTLLQEAGNPCQKAGADPTVGEMAEFEESREPAAELRRSPYSSRGVSGVGRMATLA